MRRILTATLLALMLYLLWQVGAIKKYEPPCTGRFNPCQKVEATAPEPEPQIVIEPNLRLLCQAIAVAETSGCTTGSALSHKNCHGITLKKGGYRTFNNTAESFAACEDLWRRKYVRYPDLTLAAKWSSPGAAETWLRNVTIAYESRL